MVFKVQRNNRDEKELFGDPVREEAYFSLCNQTLNPKYAEKVFFVKSSIPYLSVLYHICIYLDLHECLYVPRPASMLFSFVVCSA